jgi:hypothetical protein
MTWGLSLKQSGSVGYTVANYLILSDIPALLSSLIPPLPDSQSLSSRTARPLITARAGIPAARLEAAGPFRASKDRFSIPFVFINIPASFVELYRSLSALLARHRLKRKDHERPQGQHGKADDIQGGERRD